MENQYKKTIRKLNKNIRDKTGLDIETYHINRDKILENFIKDISQNKMKKNEIVTIAKLIKKEILDQDIELWYS